MKQVSAERIQEFELMIKTLERLGRRSEAQMKSIYHLTLAMQSRDVSFLTTRDTANPGYWFQVVRSMTRLLRLKIFPGTPLVLLFILLYDVGRKV